MGTTTAVDVQPFTAITRRSADDAIRSVDPMISKLVRKLMPAFTSQADLDEVAQEARIHLAFKVFPRFDASRAKWSTFAHRCLSMFILAYRRSWLRKRRKAALQLFDVPIVDQTGEDRAIERFADKAIKNPDILGLNPFQTRIVRAAIERQPDTTNLEMSRQVGLSPSHTSSLLSRARSKIKTLNIDS